MRLREKYKVMQIKLDDIEPESTPEKDMRRIKKSMFGDDDQDRQIEEIRVREANHDCPYRYQYINGRRRGETARANGQKTIRAIVVSDVDDRELHTQALITNSGTENYGDEAEHVGYLFHTVGMKQSEIAEMCNMGYSTVSGRLKLYDKLAPTSLALLKTGEINYSTALKLCKMTFVEQVEFIDRCNNEDKKVTVARATNELKSIQSAQAPKVDRRALFDPDTFGPTSGLFINPDNVARLLKGEEVEITINGETKCIKIC